MAGTNIMDAQAAEGMKLFKALEEKPLETDTAAAEKFKTETDVKIAELETEAETLNGKDNKRARSAKGKEIMDLQHMPQYIDACRIVKGLEPNHGFFVVDQAALAARKAAAAAAKNAGQTPDEAEVEGKKDGKKTKRAESAGLSPAETKELEQLKNDIIARKTQLKAEGMSGGQQNKDPQIVGWVSRMNSLKEKQDPGGTGKDEKKKAKKKAKAPMSMDDQKEMDKLKGEIEVYKSKLRAEFGYTNKDIKADEELKDMEERLVAFEKRS